MRRGERVEISGWANARQVHLHWAGGTAKATPDIPRPDVTARRGGPADQGFAFSIPATARGIVLDLVRTDGAVHSAAIPHPSDPVGGSGQRRLRRAFLRDLCRAVPAFVRYARDPSDRTKADIKRALGLELATRGADLEPAWLLEEPSIERLSETDDVTILLPVYNAFDLLQECLARVEQNTDVNWHLIAVEDASTDPAVRPWLTNWSNARAGRVTLLCQEANQGFVAAVNKGLDHIRQRAGTGPVILLNSDAMVPPNWVSRLCAPLSDPAVASVTPMSNAAEILSVPCVGPGIALADGEAAQIDSIAQGFGAVPLPELPTGVGFCMALSRHWLDRVPLLDPAFGRGYGEEVDWCQKTRALGARHLAQPGLFVEHVGGQSFGTDEKRDRIRAAGALISRRYPRYDAEVQRFIANDALATPRLALAVALAASRNPRLPVFLAHSLGGGAEDALQAEMADHTAGIVLRVGGLRRWMMEVHLAGQVVAGRTDDLDLVRRLLAPAEALDLIYSCGVGDSDPVTLPAALLSLRRPDRSDRMMMRLHDYFPLSPSYTLMGRDGFDGVPGPGTSDPCHIIRRPDGTHLTLEDWRVAWGALVAACDEITGFSKASALLFSQAFEGAHVTIRPHLRPVPVRRLDHQAGRRIGILGNLNIQKGALLIRDLAMAHPRQTFVVIGHVDASIPLPRNVVIHGGYDRDEITELTALYGIRAWLMPAVWPETFSFATREALATGLPVAGFSLGAQGEALREAANGIIVPLEPKSGAAERLFSTVDPARSQQVAAE